MRKLIPTLLALLSVYPAAGFALGLGEIRLNSALNQTFDAEIELLSVEQDQAASIVAGLASYETFARIGVERPPLLMDLRFEVREHADGRHYVAVTSRSPMREPFLDFVLEVNWNAGRLLREYTVLLDPPEYTADRPPVVTAPSAAVRDSGSAGNERRAVGSPSGAVASRSVPAPARAVSGTHRIRKDETLWSIAREMRTDRSATIPQVMMALLRANPHAFEEGNVNRMKKGEVLRLDDPALVHAMSAAAAAREVQRQGREWEDYKQQAARAAGRRPSTQMPEGVGVATAQSSEPRLKLVAPDQSQPAASAEAAGSGPGGEALGGVREELMVALETAEAQRQQNERLRERLEELENQLTSMQRLLSLKDNDLASLQQQMATEDGEAASEPAPASVAESGAVVVAGTTEATVPDPAEQKTETAAQPKAADAPKPKPQPRPAAPPVAEPSFLDSLMASAGGVYQTILGNPLLAGGVPAGLLVLMLLAVYMVRRRRADFQESILSGSSSLLRAKAKEQQPSEESSFFSDFAISGMAQLGGDDSEVDPLTEADVYMAYGRYQQAEELLKSAIGQEPDRQELRVKLLEVYYATKDKAAFEQHVLDVHEAVEGGGPLWDKVAVMGHELVPENPLFAQAPEGAVAPDADHARLDDEVLDIGLDLDALTAEMEGEGGHDEFNLDLGVDFSDIDDSAAASSGTATDDALDVADPVPGAASRDAAPAGSDFDLDLDLDLGESEPATGEDTAAATAADSESAADLDFDLGDLGLDDGSALAEASSELAVADVPEASEDAEAAAAFEAPVAESTAGESRPEEDEFGLGDLDLDGFIAEGDTPKADASEEADDGFGLGDLDLDAFVSDSDTGSASSTPDDLELKGAGEAAEENSGSAADAILDEPYDLGNLGEATESPAGDDDVTLGIDLGRTGSEQPEATAVADDVDLDLDSLGEFDSLGSEESEAAPAADELDVDLDSLGDFDTLGSEEPEAAAASDELDVDLDSLGDFDNLGGEEPEAAAASDELDVDLDSLGDVDTLGSEEAGTAPGDHSAELAVDLDSQGGDRPEAADSGEVAIDLDSLEGGFASLGTGEPEPAAPETAGEPDVDLDSPRELDSVGEQSGNAGDLSAAEDSSAFDIDFGDFDNLESEPGEAESALGGNSNQFDLDDLGDFGDLDDLGSADAAAAPADQSAELELPGGGSEADSFDLDAAEEADLGGAGSFDLDDELFEGMDDEVGTKLDLARAYVDMGDAEGARSILNEVINDGSGDQRQQAEELLARIS